MTQYHASVEIIFLANNMLYTDGLVQDCSISIANMLKILQYCTKPSIFEITENNIPGKHPVCVKIHNENSPFLLSKSTITVLTDFPLVLHIWVNEQGQHWFRYCLVPHLAPSHYLNRCWVIVNENPRNKLQWNFDQNVKLFIHENASENVICKMMVILSRGDELSKWFITVPQDNQPCL